MASHHPVDTAVDRSARAEALRAAVLSGANLDPLAVLEAIVDETQDYPPCKPYGADSYLPPEFVAAARAVLETAGRRASHGA